MAQDPHRGTGRTTRQLQWMKDQSCFIWGGYDLSPVRAICTRLGGQYNATEGVWTKDDGAVVHIYRRSILSDEQVDRVYGLIFREVVLDHDLGPNLGGFEWKNYAKLMERVRSEDYFHKPSVRRISSNLCVSPVALMLYCPMCHARHIDEGEWAKKPHHTHSCQHCGHTWRPAVVNTVGVQFLPGFKNT